MGRKVELTKTFSKFVLTNAVGTAVDTVVLWYFSTFIFHKYFGQYIVSPVISYEFAVTTNYLLSYYFTWRNRERLTRVRSFVKKYFIYNASCTAVFAVKMGLLLLVEMLTGWNVVFCNLVALCISGLLNFSLGEWLIFKKK